MRKGSGRERGRGRESEASSVLSWRGAPGGVWSHVAEPKPRAHS